MDQVFSKVVFVTKLPYFLLVLFDWEILIQWYVIVLARYFPAVISRLIQTLLLPL
jgi:hypothetical protein